MLHEGHRTEYHWAAFLLRLGLGLLLLIAGVNKFAGGIGPFVGFIEQMFGETWLPAIFWRPFAWAIPFIEVVLGLLLIVGVMRFWVILLSSLFMLALAVGTMIAGENETVARNFVYFALFLANFLTAPWDCFSFDTLARGR